MIKHLRAWFERFLEGVVFVLMIALAVLVAAAVVFRKLNAPIIWYDEVAVILLAWITYYGAALAALKGGHISVSALVDAMPRGPRIAVNEADKDAFIAASKSIYEAFGAEVKGAQPLIDRAIALGKK